MEVKFGDVILKFPEYIGDIVNYLKYIVMYQKNIENIELRETGEEYNVTKAYQYHDKLFKQIYVKMYPSLKNLYSSLREFTGEKL